jgi:hypothetical protein
MGCIRSFLRFTEAPALFYPWVSEKTSSEPVRIGPLLARIHPSAWKGCSANFAPRGFSEVEAQRRAEGSPSPSRS